MSIKREIISGVFYTGITRYAGILISLIIGVILSRILSPEEYGIVALVLVFTTLINLLVEGGFGPAIIQNKDLDDVDISSIFLISLVVAFVFAILFYFSAPLIAGFYSNIELIRVTQLLAASVFFSVAKVVPSAILQRDLKFKKISVLIIITQITGGGGPLY